MLRVADELVCISTKEKTKRMDLVCGREVSGWILGLGRKSELTIGVQKRCGSCLSAVV